MAYIGQRKLPKNISIENDSYLGSGTRLLYAIKKYGKKHFKKEILHICTSQEQADKLEIQEIEQRGALLDKTKFYNISPGGQFWRDDKHSEITSEYMKNYYKDDYNYTEQMIKQNRRKYLKAEKPVKYIFRHSKDIDRLKKEQLKILLQITKQHKKEIDRLIRNARLNNKSNGAIALWNKPDKENKERVRKAQMNRKINCKLNNKPFHSQEAINKYRMEKLKANGNVLGMYIINVTDIEYSLIATKIKKLITTNYKHNENLINQIEAIREIIYKNTSNSIDVDKIIKLRKEIRVNKGLV